MTPDPIISDAKVLPAKSSNKGYGDKNSFREVQAAGNSIKVKH